MSTRNNIFTALGRVFSSEIDVEEYNNEEIIMINPVLLKVLQGLESKEKEVEQPFNSNKNSDGNSLKKKYGAKQQEVPEMTHERLEKMTKILSGDENVK